MTVAVIENHKVTLVLRYNSEQMPLSHKGPYLNDVRSGGGGRVGPKADVVREVAWI